MATAHALGDEVVSTIDAQGLTKGQTYVILDVIEEHTPFGTFVAYEVAPCRQEGRPRITVRNGHLVLRGSNRE